MRPIPPRKLWLGHAGDLRDPRSLLDVGVEAVVELADNEPFVSLPRELIRCRFPLSDNGANPPWLLRLAVETLCALLEADVPTLVCCSGGLNRSVCVAAGTLAWKEDCPFDEALLAIARAGPADVSPALVVQLQAAFSP